MTVTDTEIEITNAVAAEAWRLSGREKTSVALAQLPRSTSGSFRGL
jgi:hypothetical protein